MKTGMKVSRWQSRAPPVQVVGNRATDSTGYLLVKSISITRSGLNPWRAYNLTVANDHTYFVGKQKAWVHNVDCWKGKPRDAKGTGEFTEYGQPIFKRKDDTLVYRGHDGKYYAKNGADTKPSAIPKNLQSSAHPDLPIRKQNIVNGKDIGPTAGVIRGADGKPVYFASGSNTGPGKRWYNKNEPASNQSASHVEGHAAAYMRDNGLKNLTMTINHQGGACQQCLWQVKQMLPKGHTLTVKYFNKTTGRMDRNVLVGTGVISKYAK